MIDILETIPEPFSREDESDDALFYSRPRMVCHLDDTARETVRELIAHLIVEDRPRVLDLMASFDSHIPDSLDAAEVVGLGLNRDELDANPDLTERVNHDLNREPVLPFADGRFDAVLNVVSVAYLTRPVEVFREVARVLRPGGLCLVVFSDRSFVTKAVRAWEISPPDERIDLVESYLRAAGFETPDRFRVMGRPRPPADKYASSGMPSDPVFAVFAETASAEAARSVRTAPEVRLEGPSESELAERLAAIPERGACPYCEESLRVWAVSDNPFGTWSSDLLVCVNDACPFVVRGWETMFDQGNPGKTYRFCYNPHSRARITIPVPGLSAIKNELRPEGATPR